MKGETTRVTKAEGVLSKETETDGLRVTAPLAFTVPPGALSEDDAATYLGGVSVRTLQSWRSEGLGPIFVKLGSRVVYLLEDLNRFLRKQRVDRPEHE